MDNERDVWIKEVDAALQEWQQGDYVVGEHWFVQRFHSQRPLTQESTGVAQEETDLAESEVRGFVVVTQTCDIVRTCRTRPFVEIVPLVEVDEKQLYQIQRSRQPQYAYIPGVGELNLVADLDRVMTVEKAVIAEWERKSGCQNDQEIRVLGQALARKRARFAFPDDFNQFAKKDTYCQFQTSYSQLSHSTFFSLDLFLFDLFSCLTLSHFSFCNLDGQIFLV